MYGVTRIDSFEGVALISFKKIPADTKLLADIFQHYAQNNINLDMISQTSPISNHVSISFSCFESDMVKVLAISKQLKEKYPDLRPMVSSGNCKLYVYGEDMRQTPGVFARAMNCLSETTVEPQLVTTSEVDISLLVTAAQLDEAYSALRKAFEIQL